MNFIFLSSFSQHVLKAKLLLMSAAMTIIITAATLIPFIPLLCLHRNRSLWFYCLSLCDLSSESSHLTPLLFYLSSGVPVSPLVSSLFSFCSTFMTRCHRVSSVLAVVSLSPSVHPVKPTETRLWCGSSSRAPRSPLTGSAVIMAGGVKQSLVCAIGVFACKHTWEHTHQRARSRTEDGTQTTKHLMGEELPCIDMLRGGLEIPASHRVQPHISGPGGFLGGIF